MTEYKLNIKALCALKEWTLNELADKTGITRNHLAAISCGRTKMLARDLIKLSQATGVPMENIKVD